MGYKRKITSYHLVFDGDMAGFECKVKGVSMDRYLELIRMQEDTEKGAELIEALADNLTWWNLEEDDGTPVPVSRDAVLAEDSDFVVRIFDQWMKAIGSVPDPLPASSNGGGPLPEASIPMVPLS